MDLQTIKWLILLAFLSIMTFILFFLKKKGKAIVLSVMGAAIIVFTYNELTLETRINNRYQEYEELVEIYLQKKYPNESLQLYYTEGELGTMWNYEIYVIFENEPDVIYTYTVEDKQVIQVSAQNIKDNHNTDFQHFEN